MEARPILIPEDIDDSNPSIPERANSPTTSSDYTYNIHHHHGSRVPIERGRKGVDDYVAENEDFFAQTIQRGAKLVRIIICRYCQQSIGSRSDRIKEHLRSKRHLNNKRSELCFGPFAPQNALNLTPSVAALFNSTQDKLTNQNQASSSPPSNHGINMLPTVSSSENFEHFSVPEAPGTGKPKPKAKEPLEGLTVHLQWENHQENMENMFTKYMLTEEFCDVTLCCEGQILKCHRLVLAACSPYFERMFTEYQLSNLQYPFVFLRDIKFWEAQALVEFMYQGYLRTEKGNIEALVQAAHRLDINLGQYNVIEAPSPRRRRRRRGAGPAGKLEDESAQKTDGATPKQTAASGQISNNVMVTISIPEPRVWNPFGLPAPFDVTGNNSNSSAQLSSPKNSKHTNMNLEASGNSKRSELGYQGPTPLPIKKRVSSTPAISLLPSTAISATGADHLPVSRHISPSNSVLRLRRSSADSKQDTFRIPQGKEDVSIVSQAPIVKKAQKVPKAASASSAGRSLLRPNIGKSVNHGEALNVPYSVKPAENIPYPVITATNDPFSIKPIKNLAVSIKPIENDPFTVKPIENVPFSVKPEAVQVEPVPVESATPLPVPNAFFPYVPYPVPIQSTINLQGLMTPTAGLFPITPAEHYARNLSGSDFWLGLTDYNFYERFMNYLVPRDNVNPSPRNTE